MESSRQQPRELAGIPLLADGWRLAEVLLEDSARLTARYEDGGGAGFIKVVVMPRASIDRMLGRLEHCSVFYEAELDKPDVQLRARAAALVVEVSRSVETTLARAVEGGGPGFPFGLGFRAGPSRIRRDPEGIRALLPEAAPGSELGHGWRVVDVHAGPDVAREVSIEIGAELEPRRVVLTLAPRDDARRSKLALAHFSVREVVLGPPPRAGAELPLGARAASSLLLLLLQLRDSPSLLVEPPLAATPSPPRFTHIEAVPADPALAREASLLGPYLAAAARYFGRAPIVSAVSGAAIEARAVTFLEAAARSVPAEFFLVRPAGAFGQRRAMREYFESFGFRLHEDGLLRTVPTPESFAQLMAAAGLGQHGFVPWLRSVERLRGRQEDRLRLYLAGTIGVEIAPARFYRHAAPLLGLRAASRAWCRHLTGVARRMGGQVLLTHRVPRSELGRIAAELAAAVSEPSRRRRRACVPLLELFETDLLQICQEIWQTLGRPEDFEDAFLHRTNRDRLETAIERRIAAARADG